MGSSGGTLAYCMCPLSQELVAFSKEALGRGPSKFTTGGLTTVMGSLRMWFPGGLGLELAGGIRLVEG